MNLVEKIIQVRLGGAVRRCHNIRHNSPYTNAAHQWGVAILLQYLWPDDFARLALIALVHDVPEGWVGDLPAPITRYTPGLREQLGVLEASILVSLDLPTYEGLAPADLAKLKACDNLELYMWAQEELASGNTFAGEYVHELERYFVETPLPAPADLFFEQYFAGVKTPRAAGIIKELTHVS